MLRGVVYLVYLASILLFHDARLTLAVSWRPRRRRRALAERFVQTQASRLLRAAKLITGLRVVYQEPAFELPDQDDGGKYMITEEVNKGTNRLAVLVHPPDPVGNPNGGQGGDGEIARNVMHQYVAGWDWIQPVRDRNTGIWDKVFLEQTGNIDIRNPPNGNIILLATT